MSASMPSRADFSVDRNSSGAVPRITISLDPAGAPASASGVDESYRLSVGPANTVEHVEAAIDAVAQIATDARQLAVR